MAEEGTCWPSEHSQLGKLRLVKLEMPARMRALSFERGELVASLYVRASGDIYVTTKTRLVSSWDNGKL